MSFEDIERKLQEIKGKMGRITEQEILRELDTIYEQAKGESRFGETLKDVMKELKETNKNSEKRGAKGTLTDEQIMNLEEKANTITKALEEAKELRENSEIDKIDDYVQAKIEDNERQIEEYQDEKALLEAQRTRLEEPYKEYQANQKAMKVANEIEITMDKIIEQLAVFNNNTASKGQKDEAGKKLKQYGQKASQLIKEPSVEKKFHQNINHFDAEVSEWNQTTIEKMRTTSQTLAQDYKTKAEANKVSFEARITQVPIKYQYTPVETFLQDVNKKYSKIEDKWVAIGGRINENDKKIREIKGRNATYQEYAKNVKEKAQIEETIQLSDEQLDDYLKVKQNSEGEINSDAAISQLNSLIANNRQELSMIEAKEPKDLDMKTVLEWKRKNYIEKHERKTNRQLKRINKKIDKLNKKMSNYKNIEEIEPATIEDLINNTEKVQNIGYRGKFMNNHRFGLRSRIPIAFKGRYRKQCYKGLVEDYKDRDTKLVREYENRHTALKNNIRERYKVEQPVKHSMLEQEQQKTINSVYKSNFDAQER